VFSMLNPVRHFAGSGFYSKKAITAFNWHNTNKMDEDFPILKRLNDAFVFGIYKRPDTNNVLFIQEYADCNNEIALTRDELLELAKEIERVAKMADPPTFAA